MSQITSEARGIREAVHIVQAMVQGSATQSDHAVQLLNQLLEQVQRLSFYQDSTPRVAEIEDDNTPSSDHIPSAEVLLQPELQTGITAIPEAIRDKQGVFGLEEASEITDALLGLLGTVMASRFLEPHTASVATHQHCSDAHTERDLADLRRNLAAVQGIIIMSTRRVSVNEPSQYLPITNDGIIRTLLTSP